MMSGGSMSRRKFATACWPICWHICPATTVELRQWNPAHTRALLDSMGKSEKRANVRGLPGNVGDSMMKGNSSPNTDVSTTAPAAETMVCAAGYSGCGGVARSGVQVGSGSVAGLPSVSAAGMAVTGRQKL